MSETTYLIVCPHCGERCAITVAGDLSDPTPVYQGDCRDCRYCLPCDDLDEYNIVGYCAMQGNVNPIHFTETDLAEGGNPWRAEWGQRGRFEGYPHCVAFWPKDKEPPSDEEEHVRRAVEQAQAKRELRSDD
jgi:hypothetical protein